MSQLRTSRTFDVIFVLLLTIVLGVSYVYRIAIGDAIFFWRYQPATAVAQLADDAGLSQSGRRLFYRGDPQLLSNPVDLSAACEAENIGCISTQGQIYILDQSNQHAKSTVTAAHEMLHLAYRRLSKSTKADIDAMTTRAVAQLNNDDLRAELGDYPPEERADEAHSIIGSEYVATPELEDYYKQYFSDRSKVIAAEAEALRQ